MASHGYNGVICLVKYTHSLKFGYVLIVSWEIVILLFIYRCPGANHHSETTMNFCHIMLLRKHRRCVPTIKQTAFDKDRKVRNQLVSLSLMDIVTLQLIHFTFVNRTIRYVDVVGYNIVIIISPVLVCSPYESIDISASDFRGT